MDKSIPSKKEELKSIRQKLQEIESREADTQQNVSKFSISFILFSNFSVIELATHLGSLLCCYIPFLYLLT